MFFCLLIIFFGGKTLNAQKNKVFTCKGTYYHDKFEKRKTSSGEVFSQKLYTAAHRTLPFHTIVKVTNPKTKQSILVKINDRCARHGILDLSKSAARRIGLNSTQTVKVEVLDKEYYDIWQQQSIILNDNTLTAEQIDSKIDSLMNIKESKRMYYIRLATVANQIEVNNIISQLPERFKKKAQSEKIYDENFYYVSVGPFNSQFKANIAVIELKKDYPLAHLVQRNSDDEED